jgi:hypothetical protein
VTTKQESADAALVQAPEMHGPPRHFTIDWYSAGESVRRLADLKPDLAVTGHGRAMRGPAMTAALEELARDSDRVAAPAQGRYRVQPARAGDGSYRTL